MSSRIKKSTADQSREDRHITSHKCVAPTSLVSSIQNQVASSVQALVSIHTFARHLSEERYVSQHPLHQLTMTLSNHHVHLEWCRSRRDWIVTEWNKIVFSNESIFSFACDEIRVRVKSFVVNALILFFVYSGTSFLQLVRQCWMQCHLDSTIVHSGTP